MFWLRAFLSLDAIQRACGSIRDTWSGRFSKSLETIENLQTRRGEFFSRVQEIDHLLAFSFILAKTSSICSGFR